MPGVSYSSTLQKKAVLLSACVVLIGLSGCSYDPREHETEPVLVNTPKGIVTCQLYTRDTIVWDRAIDIPQNMSIREGDEVCRQEGIRRLPTPS